MVTNRSPTAYNGTNVSYNEYNLPVAKMYQWTASVERQLGTNMEAEIAYVASHGATSGLPERISTKYRAAWRQLSQNGGAFNHANTPYPQFGTIQGNLGASVSNYNSLQVQVNRRFRGADFQRKLRLVALFG